MKRAHIPKPDIPNPTEVHGWTVEDGHIQPKWSAKNVLPIELVDIIDSMNEEDVEEDSETRRN